MKKLKKINRQQMRLIVEDYHRLLPDWSQVANETLARLDGPVVQAIAWEGLLSGEYRPMSFIDVIAAPDKGRVDFFGDSPRGRPRSILLREHEKYYDAMFDAMKQEFKPSITKPLNAQDVLELCEKEAVPTSIEAYALAALNAYLGRTDRASCWCKRYDELVNALAQPWQPSDYARGGFLGSLEGWLAKGEARAHLELVVKEERRKWGFRVTAGNGAEKKRCQKL